MKIRRGLLIHPTELNEKWTERVCASRLSLFGLHPVGGGKANESLEAFVREMPALAPHLKRIEAAGIAVEHEMHALRWLLPADRFGEHPDWFRMNEKGERVADYNLCCSNKDALAYLSERSAEIARLLPALSHRYHFWIDDVRTAFCHCAECRRLSPSDQAMRMYNAIVRGLRMADPLAKQCYLSYHATLEAPRLVEPESGIYLEYAPMDRDFSRPLSDGECEANRSQVAVLPDLFACFGHADATACEYWLDNSRYSRWTKPPKKFPYDAVVTEADLAFYEERGFDAATTFACYLGEDYEALHGDAPVGEYMNL